DIRPLSVHGQSNPCVFMAQGASRTGSTRCYCLPFVAPAKLQPVFGAKSFVAFPFCNARNGHSRSAKNRPRVGNFCSEIALRLESENTLCRGKQKNPSAGGRLGKQKKF